MNEDVRKVLVKYGEIALKGKNRNEFVNRLIGNIRKSAEYEKITIFKIQNISNRLLLSFDGSIDEKLISLVLSRVFGIKFFSFVKEVDSEIGSILAFVKKLLIQTDVKFLNIKTKRADKDFPLISPEINSRIGELANSLGIKIDYKNKENVLFVEITRYCSFVYLNRFDGLGGLPVDNSKKILMLLSGGIDSPVASFLLMKRGCHVDFIHIHNFSENKKVLDSKMVSFIDQFNKFQFSSKLFLVPYFVYQLGVMNQFYSRYDVIFFKYFIFKLAESVAFANGYLGIASGDNLNQVASQTIDNIYCISNHIKIALFRPLLCYDKEEIIVLAKRFNTYGLSIQKYPDCCSINADNPFTKCNLVRFEKDVLDKVDLDSIIRDSLSELDIFNIKNNNIERD